MRVLTVAATAIAICLATPAYAKHHHKHHHKSISHAKGHKKPAHRHYDAPVLDTTTHVYRTSEPPAPFDGFMDGMAMPLPPVIHKRPYRMTGTLTIGRLDFNYASGGSGWSIPYGDFPITPEDIGDWGRRHGAIGINGNTIPDKQLGRDREGIEIHAAYHMASAGCIVVQEFDRLKHAIMGLINDDGHAFLHVGPTGAAITAEKASPLPSIIYLAEHVADEERHAENHHHRHIAEDLPHRKHYAHHRLNHYARL